MHSLAAFLPENLRQAVHPRLEIVGRLVGNVRERKRDIARLVDVDRADTGIDSQTDLARLDWLERYAELAEVRGNLRFAARQAWSGLKTIRIVRGGEKHGVDSENAETGHVHAGVVLYRTDADIRGDAAGHGPAGFPQAVDEVDRVQHRVPDVGREDAALASLNFGELVSTGGHDPIPNCEKSPLS
jgi:hypothetical protein